MTELHALELDLPDILYEHWDSIPIIRDVSKRLVEKLTAKSPQHYIINSLSKGIEDNYPNGLRKRHALTASEIQNLMSDIYHFTINKSNLYYHLQKLVDVGLITIVTTVQKANIVTSYYGRTSKLILTDMTDPSKSEESNEKEKDKPVNPLNPLLNSPQFILLLESYNPDPNLVKDIQKLINDLSDHSFEHNKEFMDWMINNEENFRGIDLDLIDFNRVYNMTKTNSKPMID
ncbi:MAG: winged helix-turn-helix domain-containing protein [Candidatus Kariarchaeaceae archaeon]|jgi:hypothetical protein